MKTENTESLAELGNSLKMLALLNPLPPSGQPSIDAQRYIPLEMIKHGLRAHIVLSLMTKVADWSDDPAWVLGVAFMQGNTTLAIDEWTAPMRQFADQAYDRLLGDVGMRGIDNEGTFEIPTGMMYMRRTNEIDRAFMDVTTPKVH